MHRDGTLLEFEIRHPTCSTTSTSAASSSTPATSASARPSRGSSPTRRSTTRSPGSPTAPSSPTASQHALRRRRAERRRRRHVPRPRRLQDDQRQPRAPRRRRACSARSAQRLRRALRPADTAARFGGDEFAVLLEDIEGTQQAADVAERILGALERPVDVDGQAARRRARASASPDRPDRGDPSRGSAAQRRRRHVHGQARQQGQLPGVRAGDARERRRAARAPSRPAARARSSQFEVHYQPVVRLDRRRSPGSRRCCAGSTRRAGTIPPREFIPLAEETGLIVPIGRWVLHEACQQGAALQQARPADRSRSTMSVNLSAKQLQSDTIVADVRSRARASRARTRRARARDHRDRDDGRHGPRRREAAGAQAPRRAARDRRLRHRLLVAQLPEPASRSTSSRSTGRSSQSGKADSGLAAAIVSLGETLDLQVVAEGIEMPEQPARCSTSAASSARASCSRRRCRFPRWWSTSDRRRRTTSRRPTRSTARARCSIVTRRSTARAGSRV